MMKDNGARRGALAILALAALMAMAAAACVPAQPTSNMPKVGDAAPSFLATTMLDGKEVSFPAAYRGRVVMLSFFVLG